MLVHFVFVAKYRRKVFDGDAIDRLRRMFGNVCSSLDASLVEMKGEDSHMHLLVEYPPKLAVSVLVNSLKGVSSQMLRKERPDLKKRYWKMCYGCPRILQLLAVERPFPSLSSMWSNNKPRSKTGCGIEPHLVCVLYLRAKSRSFTTREVRTAA